MPARNTTEETGVVHPAGNSIMAGKKFLLSLFIFLAIIRLLPADDRIDHIRFLYSQPQSYEEIILTINGYLYCQLGPCQGRIIFRYFDLLHGVPEFIPENIAEGKSEMLYMILVPDLFPDHFLNSEGEFLYDFNGELVFCYLILPESPSRSTHEIRLYYNNGELIRYVDSMNGDIKSSDFSENELLNAEQCLATGLFLRGYYQETLSFAEKLTNLPY